MNMIVWNRGILTDGWIVLVIHTMLMWGEGGDSDMIIVILPHRILNLRHGHMTTEHAAMTIGLQRTAGVDHRTSAVTSGRIQKATVEREKHMRGARMGAKLGARLAGKTNDEVGILQLGGAIPAGSHVGRRTEAKR